MRKYMLAALCCIMSLFILTGCKSSVPENTVFSVDDLSGKKIGVQLGTTGDTLVSDYEEDGSGTVVERYNKGNDAILALKQGKIDAVVIDVQPAQSFVKTNSELMILNEEFVTEDYAMCISKNKPELKASINEALNVIKANGTLVMATNAYFKPYEYYDNGKIVGIDADMAQAVADYLGMNLKIEDMEFDSIITAVQSGKADFGAAGMTVTEDRLESVDFTDTYANASQVIIVKAD